ncbi:MAG: SUMF1/EgtB/PvdO family nonheme iron enzyme [Spirochaetaceae bacterium]|nr:SUMF1/EgtB/PvdO family nonheme iron enzyme [Spirochaetaceae bacterium]
MKEIKDLPKVDSVELPKLGNMRPGVYILAFIILAIALIVFLIGILPGLKNGGRFVNFTSDINGVGVFVDDAFVDDAFVTGLPGQDFIESGEHSITYTKGGVVLYKSTLKIDHPIFFTWLFKRTKDVNLNVYELNSEQIDMLRTFDLQMSINQSSITDFTSVINYIPYALSYAKDVKAFGFSLTTYEIDLATISSFISSVKMLDDVKSAYEYLGLDFSDNLKKAETLFNGSIEGDVGEEATTVEEASQIISKASVLNFDDVSIESVTIPTTSFVMGHKTFFTYPQVSEAGVNVSVGEFNILRAPVSQYLYSIFVHETPTWSKDNIDNLVEKGLVDNNYLKGIALSIMYPSYSPITNISYNAAVSFCKWLSTKTSKTITIPTEQQWSLAALSSNEFFNDKYSTSLVSLDSDTTTPVLMLGGVWEFTSSIFLPFSRLLNEEAILKNIKNLNLNCDIIVKGGSILNKSTSLNSVGVMESEACFDYLGFRIAWN